MVAVKTVFDDYCVIECVGYAAATVTYVFPADMQDMQYMPLLL